LDRVRVRLSVRRRHRARGNAAQPRVRGV